MFVTDENLNEEIKKIYQHLEEKYSGINMQYNMQMRQTRLNGDQMENKIALLSKSGITVIC